MGITLERRVRLSSMHLTLGPTGLSSPVYADQLDYTVFEDGRAIGRMYEDKHSRPELRWFWSITVYVHPRLGVTTSGRAPSLEEAKAKFLSSWGSVKCRGRTEVAAAGPRSSPTFFPFAMTDNLRVGIPVARG